MKVTTQITVDMLHPNVATLVYAKQTDQQSRFISATLLEGSQPWTPPTGALAAVRYRKPDGTIGWYDTTEDKANAVTISGNVATIQLTAQSLAVSGNVYIELEFYTQTAEKLSTFAWVLAVEASAVSDGEIESSDYFNVLASTLAEIEGALPNIQNAAQYAAAAAESATKAAASEADAAASKSAAASSAAQTAEDANAAGASKDQAAESATQAAASASAAASSKNAAASSATQAAESATTAGESATQAEGSARESEAWAVGTRNGQTVPDSDETHNNNSKYWAQQAAAAAGGGVITFNGRAGAVVPSEGDYTADMVGAPTKTEFEALSATVDEKQLKTNLLAQTTQIDAEDSFPLYDASANDNKKAAFSNIAAAIRNLIFKGLSGLLKSDGTGAISAAASIETADIANEAVTRAKLANDALYSPNVHLGASNATFSLSSGSVGKTFIANNSTTDFIINVPADTSIPAGFEVALFRFSCKSMKITFASGIKVLVHGNNSPLTAPSFTLETYTMVALKKISVSDYWLLTGPAEVVT